MKVSLNWLRDYVDIRLDLKDLVHLLTMAGLEVESATPVGQGLEKVVVAEIEAIRKHPNADRLSLVRVRTSGERFSIVCGATNIREGQKVPLALVGARLPNGIEIRRSKIRGEVSEGMLCSEIELGLGEDATGIMILEPHLTPGVRLDEALGLSDTVLDLSITPNRPDCLCVIGIAREIAALTGERLRYPSLALPDEGDEIHQKTSVTLLDPDLCPRYVARLIEGVTVGPSPRWMQSRLEKVGIRSINNVVDVTNYVMMEMGQPLHAFDFDLLEEGRIVVRRARQGETFVTLDGVKRSLDEEMLMICDGVKPVALAGVMGGLNSEIRPQTRTVLLESAYFHPANNRRTSKRLGLETEASYRFGRGVDYGGCLRAADRAASLIRQLSGGRVVEGALDVYPRPIRPPSISLSHSRVGRLLGIEISPRKIVAYLRNLEMDVQENGEGRWVVTPPTFRSDLEREVDLIEELARLDGYDKIPVTLPTGPPSSEEMSRQRVLEERAKDLLVQHGYHEVITYSFTSPSALDGLHLPSEDPRRRMVAILNPLTTEMSVLRTSLIPGLIETARYNLSHQNRNLKLFELKKIYLPQEGEKLPREVQFLAGLAMGMDRDPHWASTAREIDFYDLKGCIEDLCEFLQIQGVTFQKTEEIPYLHPGKASQILLRGEAIGVVGEIHPDTLRYYEIPARAYLFEIDFEALVKGVTEKKKVQPLPRFPSVFRDLSLVVEEDLEVERVEQAIRSLQPPFIDEIRLFDLYRGAPIPQGKKSLTYRLRYQASDRTLTDEEVNRVHEQVIQRLREIFRAELRS
ncbi:MAG: phenylalanine--tRNA ligase subunit beta [Desulfobacterota bacterium]|nr:phenylalanine--tRNA ligase subunit beta [Thermodesulfobacteriota bacterium]